VWDGAWPGALSSGKLFSMSQPLTADDILPLVAQLSPTERVRLFRLIRAVGNDAEAYRAAPPAANEFSSDEDALAWDSDGWESVT
jgi:hypothetical protein